MPQILFVLFILVWASALVALLYGTGYWIAAASEIQPEKKSRYGWNPLNATISPANLTVRGQTYRKKALRGLILFVSLTATVLAAGFGLKMIAMIAASLK
ncbi:hypothetical protein CMV30_03305 [Nibricoccus aquaticus]|uniref:Uncharacterized protein n=1 Tax=Nibricoccus aquaticus TaxID=2576891 RepID=A0A290Q3Q8_9BACT|nr:hypothetical protein [Nibricoccus aquaticus]ATC63063.1 hypothetical protein CMV30_03305 [Nibricoccus aquaticus]